jgi:hypothetical protein
MVFLDLHLKVFVTFLGKDGPKYTKKIQTYWNCPLFLQVGVNMFSEVLYYTAALSASYYQLQLIMDIILWYFLSLPYTFWNNEWHGLSYISMYDKYRCSMGPSIHPTMSNPVFAASSFATLTKKLNSVALVRERTIPTERPPPVGEVSANFCG